MDEIRVLLGDDHTVLRQGLRKILEDRRDWRVVAEAGNGRDAVREAIEKNPDVAVLDIGMPLLNGIEATRQILRRAPGVRIRGEILERRFFGRRLVRFAFEGAVDLDTAVDALGHVPLPPYIKRPDGDADRARYQTVFARDRGSVAAPTAGLHFDAAAIDALRARGVIWENITLHVGYGTFKPVRVERVEEHVVDPERYVISEGTAQAIAASHQRGARTLAIGTTTTRALEHAARASGVVQPGARTADLFIYPGFEFRVVNALLTNFHLPKSSLLMLVCAFAGRDLTLSAYAHAVREGFLFYSYGDAMLIA